VEVFGNTFVIRLSTDGASNESN
jgi:hypothetical protein